MAERCMTLSALLRGARERLAAAGVASPGLDARVLVSGVLGFDAKDMIVDGEREIDATGIALLEDALLRRIAGEPVYRILGRRPFFGLELELSAGTLEPRPDTEILVEAVAPHVARHAAEQGVCRIADLGTGTGAIGLALLSLCPQAYCTGIDISRNALDTAAGNARRADLSERFATVESDWFAAIEGCFDVIVANPPYVPSGDIASLSVEVRDHDPEIALDGGRDGLAAYRLIARDCPRYLGRSGLVGVEHGFDQADRVEAIFGSSGFRLVSRHADLAGHERASLFSLGPSGIGVAMRTG